MPLVFYVAHTSVVFVNKMLLAGLLTVCSSRPFVLPQLTRVVHQERVNPEFEALFETGVDEMSWDDTENYRMGGAFKWPAMDAVFEYRKFARSVLCLCSFLISVLL